MSALAPRKALSPDRVRWRAVAAELVHQASTACVEAGEGEGTLRAIAAKLGVSGAHMQRAADPRSGVALAFGDVLAGPRAWRDRVLALAVAHVAESSARVIESPVGELLRITVKLGELAGATVQVIADGVVTPEEWEEVEGRLLSIETMCRNARAACGAARRASGGMR